MMAAVQQNGRQSHSSYSTQSLLGIATLLVVLLAVLPSYPSSAMSALSSGHHSLSKRSFFDINCKGLYDKSIFARLDRICQDCYSLYREPELHTLCRKNCFTTNYFKGCLDALLINDEKNIQSFMKDISIIHQIPI
ncbi:putative ion transport peptide-like precursor [Daphnia sinensis]|uniref:Ion transport peptide-like n=1 Tax=Daphnia sinensis TaxID=1820382 RepID=A0AAD5PYM7_9CRUS|nr:putative ion transport peptide-like precursor [Daphnia sinensis]